MADSFERHLRPKAGRTLLVGSRQYPTGRRDRGKAMFPKSLGIDMLAGEGVDVVHDLENPLPLRYGEFDHVECLSVLEHARKPWLLAENMQRVLVYGGTLYVRAPFVWREHAYPSDYFRFTVEGLKALFTLIEWERAVLICDGSPVERAPHIKGESGVPYFARTEAALFGRRVR